jgi:hypothetical protein
MADVLTAVGAYDGRKISDIDVVAWHRAVGDLDRDDALAAVIRHHGHTTDWMKPGHLRQLVQDIRNERAAARQHEIRELPSRFEADPERDDRISRGVHQGVHELVARWAMPGEENGEDPIHEAALHRARRERGRRDNPALTKRRTSGGPGIQLEKVTRPPEWADDKAREHTSINALHAAGRACGRHHCGTCRALAEVNPLQPEETPA